MYTIEKANLVAELLRRFTSGYAHHVVGQISNLDFWIHEVQESVKTIDGYNQRFNALRDAQKEWVDAHNTTVFDFCPHCNGKCELSNGAPPLPVRMSSSDLKMARKALVDAAYFFLLRCHRMGLLDEGALEEKCREIGTSVDPLDKIKK